MTTPPPESPDEYLRRLQEGSAAPGSQPGGQPESQPGWGAPQPNPYQPAGQQQPGWAGQQGWAAAPPPHPQANTALILGLVSLIGGWMCLLPFALGPFAWVTGRRVMREIDAAPGQYGGRGNAQAGMITGIISTVLLVLGLFAMVAFVGIFVIAASTGY
ncbi:DUF4190 domain-containing protein [Nocardioides limicola]|uniref:DUF4190 domain-containing protein n=1 Tax=Nocardioides limicola TaxID=2803368 RepID=UPI00193C6A22|nr:DUF4190 domain-containing protein [Nocardioides sp. DJM-14]